MHRFSGKLGRFLENHNFQPEIGFSDVSLVRCGWMKNTTKPAEHWGKGSALDTRKPADGCSSMTQACDYLFKSPGRRIANYFAFTFACFIPQKLKWQSFVAAWYVSCPGLFLFLVPFIWLTPSIHHVPVMLLVVYSFFCHVVSFSLPPVIRFLLSVSLSLSPSEPPFAPACIRIQSELQELTTHWLGKQWIVGIFGCFFLFGKFPSQMVPLYGTCSCWEGLSSSLGPPLHAMGLRLASGIFEGARPR